MILYWNALLELLPPWIRLALGEPAGIREIRLRVGQPPQICTGTGQHSLCRQEVRPEDISFLAAMASRSSAYAVATLAKGYITARGGHRVGLSGTGIIKSGGVAGLKEMRSACIRVARDVPGAAQGLAPKPEWGSVLILGPPGSGKTTLARDLIRELSGIGQQISVIDERGELFPTDGGGFAFLPGPCTDVFTGIPKSEGIEMALCSMSPGWIAVDEISRQADCKAMEQAGYCGIRFLATCHARCRDELYRRPVYRELMETGLFRRLITMQDDHTFTMEELE